MIVLTADDIAKLRQIRAAMESQEPDFTRRIPALMNEPGEALRWSKAREALDELIARADAFEDKRQAIAKIDEQRTKMREANRGK